MSFDRQRAPGVLRVLLVVLVEGHERRLYINDKNNNNNDNNNC